MAKMKREAVLAGGGSASIFAGDPFATPQRAQLCNGGTTGSATGLVLGITVGARLIQVESPVDILGTFPVIPDQMGDTFIALPLEVINYAIRNTTGGNLTYRSQVLMQDA
jgi:hypothetical protein